MVCLMLFKKSELCLCEFSGSLNEPEYKLSRHLKILKSSGIITSVRDGKWIYHSLVFNHQPLELVYKSIQISMMKDPEVLQDIARFKKLKIIREKGRCRQNFETSDSSKDREVLS